MQDKALRVCGKPGGQGVVSAPASVYAQCCLSPGDPGPSSSHGGSGGQPGGGGHMVRRERTDRALNLGGGLDFGLPAQSAAPYLDVCF